MFLCACTDGGHHTRACTDERNHTPAPIVPHEPYPSCAPEQTSYRMAQEPLAEEDGNGPAEPTSGFLRETEASEYDPRRPPQEVFHSVEVLLPALNEERGVGSVIDHIPMANLRERG